MVGRIDVKNSRELQAVILAIKVSPTEVRKQIRQQTKVLGQQEWQWAMRQQAATRLEHRVLADTSRVTVSDQNIKLSAATVGKALAGGLQPKEDYAAVEFGANRNKTKSYSSRSSKGRSFQVHNRHVNRQLTWRARKGRVFYPAAADFIPRIASLWTQTVVRTIAEALEGK